LDVIDQVTISQQVLLGTNIYKVCKALFSLDASLEYAVCPPVSPEFFIIV
jgi:hypothetical protein